jgi:addiction module RelE/StbE family toxin
VLTTPFKRGFKNLKRIEWMSEKAKEALKMLGSSTNPRELGRLKRGSLNGLYGYDLSSDCRLLYSVDDASEEIVFLRVCSHKEVYRQ